MGHKLQEGARGVEVGTLDYGRAPTEREVLRALWASPGEHLVRSEIHRRMPRAHRPTLGRVGQILSAFYRDALLERVDRRSQGSRKAGFYSLSERGRELCRQLGFEHEERQLFPVTEEMLRIWLTREHLLPKPPGKIVAVYGYRGRLGRTTLVAHVARGLAESLGDGKELLVVDLDLETPGLDDFFPPQESWQCRGLGGLLLDFERMPPQKRTLWLRGALSRPEYVLRPLDDVPGLVYLPNGLSPGQGGLSPSERTETLELLRGEAGLSTPTAGRSDPALKPLGFLPALRDALLAKFERVVIDTQSGHSLGAWIGVQALSDHLVLCAQDVDESPATLAGLRAVLASFLNDRAASNPGPGLMFLFRLTQPTTQDGLDQWIDRHLAIDDAKPNKSLSYPVDQLVYDVRLAEHRHRWENAHFYRHLIARFDPDSAGAFEISSPELQALQAVLTPERDQNVRSVAAGVLENVPLRELARWVDWCALKGELPKKLDSYGEKLILGIVEAQSNRLLSRIVQSRKYRLYARQKEVE